jgi:hypothetical protein
MSDADELEKLYQLKAKGALTEEEFSRKKAQMLGGTGVGRAPGRFWILMTMAVVAVVVVLGGTYVVVTGPLAGKGETVARGDPAAPGAVSAPTPPREPPTVVAPPASQASALPVPTEPGPAAVAPAPQVSVLPALAAPLRPAAKAPSLDLLTIGEDNVLLYDGKPLDPEIQGNNSLEIVQTLRLGSSDVALIADNGGSACPTLYYMVSVSAAGPKASATFGTCSDLIRVGQEGDTIWMTMPAYRGPFSSKLEQQRAAKEVHRFVYKSGVVTENGKPIK